MDEQQLAIIETKKTEIPTILVENKFFLRYMKCMNTCTEISLACLINFQNILGLMAWELWNQEYAFKRQRDARLDHFIQTMRMSFIRSDEDNPFDPLINRCVHAPAERRLTSTEWVNEIRKIDLKADGLDSEGEATPTASPSKRGSFLSKRGSLKGSST